MPIVLIGHTKNLGWSHTVSTARRFTPFELKLVPGSPTSYLYDGQIKQMTADRVTVKVPGAGGRLEDRSRTLYSTVHGPVFTSILGLPLFPWSPAQAHAMGDANAANFRYLNHFFETNMAQSVREYDRVLRRNMGIPWVNSIAADSKGEAYYADLGVVPNVSNAKAARRATRRSAPRRLTLLGIPILDGSRAVLPLGHRPRLGPARHVRPVEDAEHVPARLRDELERQLLAVQPQAAARGVRAHHRRRAHDPRPAHASRAADRPAAGQVPA